MDASLVWDIVKWILTGILGLFMLFVGRIFFQHNEMWSFFASTKELKERMHELSETNTQLNHQVIVLVEQMKVLAEQIKELKYQ